MGLKTKNKFLTIHNPHFPKIDNRGPALNNYPLHNIPLPLLSIGFGPVRNITHFSLFCNTAHFLLINRL